MSQSSASDYIRRAAELAENNMVTAAERALVYATLAQAEASLAVAAAIREIRDAAPQPPSLPSPVPGTMAVHPALAEQGTHPRPTSQRSRRHPEPDRNAGPPQSYPPET